MKLKCGAFDISTATEGDLSLYVANNEHHTVEMLALERDGVGLRVAERVIISRFDLNYTAQSMIYKLSVSYVLCFIFAVFLKKLLLLVVQKSI